MYNRYVLLWCVYPQPSDEFWPIFTLSVLLFSFQSFWFILCVSLKVSAFFFVFCLFSASNCIICLPVVELVVYNLATRVLAFTISSKAHNFYLYVLMTETGVVDKTTTKSFSNLAQSN